MTAQPKETPAALRPVEQIGYADVGDRCIYHVVHEAARPCRGAVLLVGAQGSERVHSYITCVRWARHLAAQGYDVLRFDYGGSGESTGAFERMTLSDWEDDTRNMAELLKKRASGVPLILHGFRLGALLASSLFRSGIGDALLLWQAPASGRQYLQEMLRRKLTEEMAIGRRRRGREEYVEVLESGEALEVEGHPWSKELWIDAEQHSLEVPGESETRPWVRIRLGGVKEATHDRPHDGHIPMPMPAFWSSRCPWLLPDLGTVFEAGAEWIEQATGAHAGTDDAVSEPRGSAATPRAIDPNARSTASGVRRQVTRIESGREELIGTVHSPPDGSHADVGVLLLNFGHTPRSGLGDLSVLIADRLAVAGYLSARFDLPGLGDSPGEIPTRLSTFFRYVQDAGHADVTARLGDELARRHGLKSVVVGGICGAAVTAIWTAVERPKSVVGLLLLEPDFTLLEEQSTTPGGAPERRSSMTAVARKLTSSRSWLRVLTGESRLGGRFPRLRGIALAAARWSLGRRFPNGTNVPLVRACRRVSQRRVPMTVITAGKKLRDVYLAQVDNEAFGPGERSHVSRLAVTDTNHVFTTSGARERVLEEIETWMRTQFPSAVGDDEA